MRYIAPLISVLILAFAGLYAYADETKPPDVTVKDVPIEMHPPSRAETPANPTAWVWSDMDASDINTLSACANELPKRIADPFIERLRAHIKPVVK
jgi:hypothetical protein